MAQGLDPLTRTAIAASAGDVVGPASAINERIAVFDGTTGKLIKDGGSTIAEIVAGSGGLVTSVFGRTGAIVAATNDYTWAQINKTTSSLADLATRSAGDLSSGTLPAGRMPALTGDVTSSAGSVSTTIANNAVSLAKLADIATASFLGRNTAGTGDPEVLSIATAKTMLGLAGSNTGDVTLAGENYLSIAGQVITANPVNLGGSHVTGTLPAASGGTGQVSYAVGDLLYASDATALSKLAGVAAGNALISGGVATAPSWGKIGLTTHVSGTLPVTNGGTGTASQFTAGSVVFAGGSGIYAQDNANLFWNDSTNRLGIGTATPSQALEVAGNVFVNAATANLYLKDASSGWQCATSTVVTPQINNHIRSTNYTSGLVGWNISAVGDAEFNNVDVRGAIRASIITYNAITATSGTLGVFKAAGKLLADVVVPASPTYGTTEVTMDVEDMDGLSHAASRVFLDNEIVRFKDGLVGDTWFKVKPGGFADMGTHWRYGLIIMAGTNNVTYRAGLGVADYGLTGQGFIIQTADQTNSPYLQMATHPATFTSADASGTLNTTPRLRIGNLNGSYGYASNVYGFAAGQYGTAGQSWVTVDPTNGVRIGNDTTTRIQLAADGSGFLANNNISWTTAGVASISGWTINAASISSGTTYVASNVDPPAGQVTWYGKSATGFQGLFIRDASNRQIDMLVGNSTIYPYLRVYDGTRARVVLGGLNAPWGAEGSVDSIGLKIWDSSGSLLVHFSDVANIIGGWTVSNTKISSTGINLHSGANAALAFGSTPPTSASAGTGIWLDRTGLSGLASSVLQVKLDATTGALVAGAGNVTLDANGVNLVNGTAAGNRLKWFDGSRVLGEQWCGNSAGTGTFLNAQAHSVGTGSTANNQITSLSITADNSNTNGGGGASLDIIVHGPAHSTRPNNQVLFLTWLGAGGSPTLKGGLIVGPDLTFTTALTASTALEVRSTVGAFLLPRMTSTQRDALTATNGFLIYNTTIDKAQARAGGAWVDLH